ncbi:MAG: phenylalanine--tRNA ligase subunit alpha [Nitrospirae bacterium]|nr:MAG: phenylalanine--tRNA ligase subunit alpha [Nitrospirota bacterium]
MDLTTIETLHPLEIKVLLALAQKDAPQTDSDLVQSTGLEPSQISMALGWLQTKSLVRLESETVIPIVSLTEVGFRYLQESSPPEWILRQIEEAHHRHVRLTVQALQTQSPFPPNALSRAIGLLKKEGSVQLAPGGSLEATGLPSSLCQQLRAVLQQLGESSRPLEAFPPAIQSLIKLYAVKRGNTNEPFRIEDRTIRAYLLTDQGRTLAEHVHAMPKEEVSQLTPEMLKDGSWRNYRFRKYTITLRPPRLAIGRRHPYREFLDVVKIKLISMGFQEMRGPLVETEFWNMDALFMPQFHPARAIHDVYFVKHPTHATSSPEPFLSRVAAVHEHGGETGSRGWRYRYDKSRAQRLILRSQGTAVSARTLASNPRIPGKYFSIARCFRYDQVDATHATDFFQVEGIVLGEDIHFRTLLGLLQLFATEMAQAQEIRVFPAYFPFTEPSVELHVRHPKLGWMELGGAGLFRPEVTIPLGVHVPVIAWGLGLDRMAMVALGIHDIRDLFTADLEAIRTMRGQFP